MTTISAKHAAVRDFYARREQIAAQGVTHEMAVRESFKTLLEQVAGANKWTLVVEQKVEGLKNVVRPDGTMRDANTLPRGYWEAKDTRDDLNAEIDKKFARGYPKSNIIFEDTRRAVLIQTGQRVGEYDLTQPEEVATLLTRFLSYTEPNIAGFEQAVERFKTDTPEIAKGLLERITEAHKSNKKFQSAFAEFFALSQTALNPNISRDAVNEMLIQHLLTERLMGTVFDNPDFAQRNAIAIEVEKVIKALTSQSFSRKQFLGQLDYFYEAIEAAARTLSGFTERQHFINTVYERFFQGYAVKVADTHGIVYTPQPIVDFMCAAVEEVLRDEFGYSLDHPDVCVIDPATGTGNFIINLLHRIHRANPAALPEVYNNRLFANEVMLLPYYVASLNIEHAYFEMTGRYEPFEGLCFVDTLDLAEGVQQKLAFMTEKNSERVERQKQAKITVIIGNPPYNVGQLNENDNNKNRKYDVIDSRVRETYAKDSAATNKNALADPYVKFFRWAADRLQGRDGIVCYVTNNSFVDQIAFDGMRKHLLQDFTQVYHLDLHGNVRQNPKLSGTTHNVFGIQVGVGITVAVRSSKHITLTPNPSPSGRGELNTGRGELNTGRGELDSQRNSTLTASPSEQNPAMDNHPDLTPSLPENPSPSFSPRPEGEGPGVRVSPGRLSYHRVPEFWRKEEKLGYLQEMVEVKGRENSLNTVEWGKLTPDTRNTWLIAENADEFAAFIPIGSKETKSAKAQNVEAIFKTYGRGVATTRDEVVYDFDRPKLIAEVQDFIENYNAEVDRYKRAGKPQDVDNFVRYDKIKWSRDLKLDLKRSNYAEYHEAKVRTSLYRPFCKQNLFFDRVLNEEVYVFPSIFPTVASESENKIIWLKVGTEWPMFPLMANTIVDLLPSGGSQCFPFYTYDEDGSNRRENITDWALAQFRAHYAASDSPLSDSPRPDADAEGLGVRVSEGLGVRVQSDAVYRTSASEAMTQIARELRQKHTPAEVTMWEALRNRRLDGLKFRRQHAIENTAFVADFLCYEARLVVEIDGGIHHQQQTEDADRQAVIEDQGYRVLRFTNEQVFNELESVLTTILANIQPSPPTPSPITTSHSNNPQPPAPSPSGRRGERQEQVYPLDADAAKQEANDPDSPYPVSDSPRPEGEGLGVRVAAREITKWDIFYYVYGLLHHPAYRERYADNLKRDLPRIPLVGIDFPSDSPHPVVSASDSPLSDSPHPVVSASDPPRPAASASDSPRPEGEGPGVRVSEGPGVRVDLFWAFADAGRKLANLHLNYETVKPYPLDYRWTPGKPVTYRVEKMRLAKDKLSLQINDSLTLHGIPPQTFDYRLGNRSALDWVIDQYQVKTDSRSGITSDPNAYSDDEKYIVNLVGQVVAVSLKTVEIVDGLPGLG